MDMERFLPPEHKITERGYMKYPPFGIDERGMKIEDVRGHAIVVLLDYVRELVRRREYEKHKDLPPPLIKEAGERAAKEAVKELVSRLNGAIRDEKLHVTEESLGSPWNSYSGEFFQFAVEFAKEITGEKDLCLKLGMEKYITSLVAIVGKPFPMEYCYKMVDLQDRFSKGVVKLEVSFLEKGKVIFQIKANERYKEMVGEYFPACSENSCLIRKGILIAAPQKIHNLPPAKCRDIKCLAKGDEYCEMELTWEVRQSVRKRPILIGMASSAALFFGLNPVLQCSALKITLSGLPFLIGYHLADRWRLAEENQKREKLVAEQQEYINERYKELEDAHIQIQATNIELKERLQQLTKAQESLIQAEKLAALGRLSSYISHELRNPLTSIKNALFYLKKKIPQDALAEKDPKVVDFLRILDGEVDTCTNIINHILDFTRIKRLSLSEGDIVAILRHSLHRCHAPEGVEVLEEIPPKLPAVQVDSEQITMVFRNLIQNAFEAMPKGGTLKIAIRADREWIDIDFVDTGHGISEENLKRIFEPLFTSKTKGTGLGLSICREIIERHGGSIAVESKLDVGSTFSVRLPIMAPGSVEANLSCN